MRRLLILGIAVGAVSLGTLAHAQRYEPGYDRGYDRGYNRGAYSPDWVSSVIGRVHADLNRSYGGWRFSHGDRKRLDHAEHELRDFARQWNRGRFDKGELDDAIGSIQHVVDNNHMPERDRRALWDDLGQLRQMREAYNRRELGYYDGYGRR